MKPDTESWDELMHDGTTEGTVIPYGYRPYLEWVLREWTNALFRQHTSDLLLCWEQSTSVPVIYKDWGAIHVFG